MSATAISAQANSDARTWLIAVLANYVACLHVLTGSPTLPTNAHLNSLSALARTTLALLSAISLYISDVSLTCEIQTNAVVETDRVETMIQYRMVWILQTKWAQVGIFYVREMDICWQCGSWKEQD